MNWSAGWYRLRPRTLSPGKQQSYSIKGDGAWLHSLENGHFSCQSHILEILCIHSFLGIPYGSVIHNTQTLPTMPSAIRKRQLLHWRVSEPFPLFKRKTWIQVTPFWRQQQESVHICSKGFILWKVSGVEEAVMVNAIMQIFDKGLYPLFCGTICGSVWSLLCLLDDWCSNIYFSVQNVHELHVIQTNVLI